MLKLNTIKSPKGTHKNTKRLGRGQGSGQGTQAGKGHKGQKARTGGSHRLGFEGGQMPLYRRLPKRGFGNAPFKVEYSIVNLGQLQDNFKANEEVTRETLKEKGLLTGAKRRGPIKILAKGEFSTKLKFTGAIVFSTAAKTIIEKCGGTIVLPKNVPVKGEQA